MFFLEIKLTFIFFSLAIETIFSIWGPTSLDSEISMYETFLFESKVSITECLPSICRKAFLFLEYLDN